MSRPSWLLIILVILLLNAGLTIILINTMGGRDGKNQATERAAAVTRHNAITAAVGAVEPAVISVNVIKTEIVRIRDPFGIPFFDFFDFIPRQREVQSIGSGVIYDPDGYLITNAHVVQGATQIKVILPDRREFPADIVKIDNSSDLAILKISGNGIPWAKLGSASDLIIGEWSIALGNPYGILMNDSKPSVSVGVISATNRNFSPRGDGRSYKNMIQTDAAINPGNSGGPLININGEVIGINTFIFSESGGNIGIGFAIPVDTAKNLIQQL
ncbi:MAG: trypsin-like peptidase domain-containing protein [Candidatus Cloacimonetes bacterium]|nr:trypsin-like peptidase domain-containing protein [Candidatus Cloacimonadota bacterium]